MNGCNARPGGGRATTPWRQFADLRAVVRRIRRRAPLGVAALGLFAGAHTARASLTVLLEQPYGRLNVIAPSGHSAIYFDHICSEGPLRLRPCEPGELGVVISRYDGIGDHDWAATPLVPYLYAVTEIDEIPTTVDRGQVDALRDVYRRRYLEAIAPDLPDGSAPTGNWYELAGSAYDRTTYGFRVDTTMAQDAVLIAGWNDERNHEQYNYLYRNCADFARNAVNTVYPHAVRRNFIADAGITTPKSVVRGMAHYSKKHPGTGFTVFVIPQVPGSIPRSHSAQDLSEGLLKRLGIPLIVLSPELTGAILIAYVGHGRFTMPKNAPVLNLEAIKESSEIVRPFPMVAPTLPEPRRLLPVPAVVATTPGTLPAIR